MGFNVAQRTGYEDDNPSSDEQSLHGFCELCRFVGLSRDKRRHDMICIFISTCSSFFKSIKLTNAFVYKKEIVSFGAFVF